MTREEAIRRLKEYAQYSYGIWHNDEEDTKAFDMAIEALQDDAVQGWIPCSERLPDVDVEVLATVDWSDVRIAWLKKGGTWETDEYILANDEILAWMPLPKPYREDGEA